MGMDEHACECGNIKYSITCKDCYAQDVTNEMKAKMLDKILAYFDNDAPPFEDLVGRNAMMPLWKLLKEAEKL